MLSESVCSISMKNIDHRIIAKRLSIADTPTLGTNVTIRADEIVLGRGVRIADDVEIVCDRLELGDGCTVGKGTVLLSPEIVCAEGCSLGGSVHAELNHYFRLGRYSNVGSRTRFSGQGVQAGEFLWMKGDCVVGGGGAQGPHSYLRIGNRCTIIDKCYLNLSEEIEIGDSTALSYNVALLTHGAWQPALMGFPAKFGPVHIGSNSVVYLNAVVTPGVSIGNYCAVGAGSIVNRDVPDHSLAAGNPARVIRTGDYPHSLSRPQIDSLIRSTLRDYLITLEPKGVRILEGADLAKQYAVLEFMNQRHVLAFTTAGQAVVFDGQPDITIAFGDAPRSCRGRCHFDLAGLTATGELTRIGEDLRDYLRRRAIRIFTDKPFCALPLANLSRLRAQRLEMEVNR